MKAFRFFCYCLVVFPLVSIAQTRDTLRYDGMRSVSDGQLVAVTKFPGEMDVIFNTRFSPTERCVVEGVILGFSVVKFQPTGNDSLAVWVFEASAVPPLLVSVVKTYKVNLGDSGFPAGNVNSIDPLSSGARDEMYLQFNPPVVIAPRRDFIIGMKLLSKQSLKVGEGTWSGLTVATNAQMFDYERFRRYQISESLQSSSNLPVSLANRYSLFMRAVVTHDATLSDTTLVGVSKGEIPEQVSIHQPYPNPITSEATITFSLPTPQRIRLTLLNTLGTIVGMLSEDEYNAGTHAFSFTPASDLPRGLYFLQIENTTSRWLRPLLLIR